MEASKKPWNMSASKFLQTRCDDPEPQQNSTTGLFLSAIGTTLAPLKTSAWYTAVVNKPIEAARCLFRNTVTLLGTHTQQIVSRADLHCRQTTITNFGAAVLPTSVPLGEGGGKKGNLTRGTHIGRIQNLSKMRLPGPSLTEGWRGLRCLPW